MNLAFDIEAAAELLWHNWRDGTVINSIPLHMQPKNLDEGYAIQNCFAEVSKNKVIGRKIAATSKEGQRHIGIDHPIQGLLLDKFCFSENSFVPNHGLYMACAEPEFAFKIAENLDGKKGSYNSRNIAKKIESLFLAIEFPETRITNFNDVGAAQLIADNGCAGYFVMGCKVNGWKELDLAKVKVSVKKNGVIQETGEGSAAYGGPLSALAWLANDAVKRGSPIIKDEIITTGTCTKPIHIEGGSKIHAIFEDLGEVVAQVKN
jgi:2-keto-4-pentenoate hydratase